MRNGNRDDITSSKNKLARIITDPEVKVKFEEVYQLFLSTEGKVDPVEIIKFLTQFSDSLRKLSDLKVFQGKDNKARLVDFARQVYLAMESSLLTSSSHNKKLKEKLDVLDITISTIGPRRRSK